MKIEATEEQLKTLKAFLQHPNMQHLFQELGINYKLDIIKINAMNNCVRLIKQQPPEQKSMFTGKNSDKRSYEEAMMMSFVQTPPHSDQEDICDDMLKPSPSAISAKGLANVLEVSYSSIKCKYKEATKKRLHIKQNKEGIFYPKSKKGNNLPK